jgi:hypothetical protein
MGYLRCTSSLASRSARNSTGTSFPPPPLIADLHTRTTWLVVGPVYGRCNMHHTEFARRIYPENSATIRKRRMEDKSDRTTGALMSLTASGALVLNLPAAACSRKAPPLQSRRSTPTRLREQLYQLVCHPVRKNHGKGPEAYCRGATCCMTL